MNDGGLIRRGKATLSRDQREMMVERLLRGECATAIASDLGVDRTLPALRAYTWGFIDQRLFVVRPEDLTEDGRAWLAARPATDQPERLPK